MYPRKMLSAALVAVAFSMSTATLAQTSAGTDGVIKVKSAYSMNETIARIKDDIAKKGIMFFAAVDQQDLAAKAGIELPPSTLLMFGNPALGSQFITAKAEAGLLRNHEATSPPEPRRTKARRERPGPSKGEEPAEGGGERENGRTGRRTRSHGHRAFLQVRASTRR